MPRDPLADLPTAEEAEREVIGACLLDPSAAELVADILRADDFAVPRHRLLWGAIEGLVRRGEPITLPALLEELTAAGTLERSGGAPAISELAASVATAANVEYHARLVREASVRRQMIEAARRIVEVARDQGLELDAAVTRAEELLWQATRIAEIGSGPAHWGPVIGEALEDLVHPERRRPPVQTGIPMLDTLTGGLHPGELTVVAARPSMGKSALLQQVVEREAQRGPVVFFSAEMGPAYVAQRALAAESGVPSVLLQNGALTDEEISRLAAAGSRLMARQVYLDTTSSLTTFDILARTRRLAAKLGRLRLVAVDYLQFLADAAERGQTRDELVGGMTRRLKALARELDVPVLLASQLRRAADGRRPTLADLRESGSIEQDADVVLMIWADEAEEQAAQERGDRGIRPRYLEVAKNRQGPVGEVPVFFLEVRQRFQERASRRVEEVPA